MNQYYIIPAAIISGICPLRMLAESPSLSGWEKMGFTGVLIAAVVVLFNELKRSSKDLRDLAERMATSTEKSNQILGEQSQILKKTLDELSLIKNQGVVKQQQITGRIAVRAEHHLNDHHA